MSDDKAKDVLDQLTLRRQAGELTHERVGRRRTSGPGSARRARLFERLGLADPYDPDAKERPIELGAVALKLTQKRQPAPHLKVKDRKQKPRGGNMDPASFKPKGIPNAAKPKPPRPKPKGPPKPPPGKEDAAPPGPDGAPRLPVRPDLGAEPTGPRRPPIPSRPAHATQGRNEAGRFRLRRTAATGPKQRSVPERAPLTAPEPESPESPERRLPPAGNDAGLDDLFGFAGEGRMKRPRKPDGDD